MQSLCLPNI